MKWRESISEKRMKHSRRTYYILLRVLALFLKKYSILAYYFPLK